MQLFFDRPEHNVKINKNIFLKSLTAAKMFNIMLNQ